MFRQPVDIEFNKDEGCEFCQNFDFGSVRPVVEDMFGGRKIASLSMAGGSSRFQRHWQFDYCPVCGRRLP